MKPADTRAVESGKVLLQAGEHFGPVSGENLRRGAGCGRTQIRDEIRDGEINFMPNCAQHRDRRGGNCPRHDLLIELPEIFDAAPAARHHNDVDTRQTNPGGFAKISDRARNLRAGASSLNAHGIDEHFDSGMATVQHLEKIADRGPSRGSHQAYSPRKARQGAFSPCLKESLGRQLLLQRFELRLQQSLPTAPDKPHNHLILPARFINRHHSEGLHALAVREFQYGQGRRGTAEEHTGELAEIVLECEVLMPGRLPAVV